MKVIEWILVTKYHCNIEGGFVQDWVALGEQKYPNV